MKRLQSWIAKRPLALSFSLLLVVLAATLVSLVMNEGEGWLQQLVPNLAAELIGILAVVALIDTVIRSRDRNERQYRQDQAFRQLRIPLVRHLQNWLNMFKAALEEPPPREYQVTDVFDEDFVATLQRFDFSADAPIQPPRDWFDYLADQFREFKAALERTVDAYGPFLQVEHVDVMEGLINSNVMQIVLQVPAIKEVHRQMGIHQRYAIFSDEMWKQDLLEYTGGLVKLIDRYNEVATDEHKIRFPEGHWRADVAPSVGSARINS